MKNKKGFTLIELLAVIVILAIIALIVTPVVSNIVANARIAANARSVEGHIRNIELAIITKAFGENSTGDLDSFDTITSGATIESSLSRPGNDNVTCTSYVIKHGTVISAGGCKDIEEKWGKTYTYSNSEGAVVFEFKGTYVAKQEGETHKGVVYMDPTDVKAVCNANSSITTTPSGCKKFYIYDDSGDTYKMILDRNLGGNIPWINRNDYIAAGGTQGAWDVIGKYNLQGPITANKELISSTSSWLYNARMISANEIRTILSNDTTSSDYFYFGSNNTTSYSSQTEEEKAIQRSYHWLFDYTKNCTDYGCEVNSIYPNNTNGYWTSDAAGSTQYTWGRALIIDYVGELSVAAANVNGEYGIRPVLEIPKSLIG